MDIHILPHEPCPSGVLDVLLQLRTQFDRASLSQQISQQQGLGYQLVFIKSNDRILAVAGFRISENLAWGKHLYIDDFVTNGDCRSTGVGQHFMQWFKAYARQQGCQQIHLDSSVQRFKAHKFYLQQGFNIASHHFVLPHTAENQSV